jgi:hypothetical protein
VLYFTRQEYGAAGEQLRAGLALCDEHGLSSIRMYTLANLTEHAVHMRDTEPASRYARRALEIAESSGNRAIVSWLNLQLAHIAQRNDLPGARAHRTTRWDRHRHRPPCAAARRRLLPCRNPAGWGERLRTAGAYAARHPSIPPQRTRSASGSTTGPAPDLSPAWPGMTLDVVSGSSSSPRARHGADRAAARRAQSAR